MWQNVVGGVDQAFCGLWAERGWRRAQPMPPATFLRPSAEEKLAIRAKSDEAERRKKADAKVKAAERKKKRAEDAERVQAIKTNIMRERPTPPPEERQFQVEDRIKQRVAAYLASPPYYGRSERSDKDRVKELCGEGHRLWDKERKLWGTRLAGNLEPLINSRKWMPFGIEDDWLPCFVTAVRERVAEESAHAEALANVKWDNSVQEIKEQQEAQGSTAHLNVEQRAAATKKREADDVMVDATAEDVGKCARLGFSDLAIATSRRWTELGPRAGMSDESRLLRWVDIVRSDRRCDFERVPEVLWNPARLEPELDRAVAQVVAQLNSRALAACG